MNFLDVIEEIEEKIGYSFCDKSLLKQAFTRTSFCNEHKIRGGLPYQSNEVLEFIGDSALSAAIVTLLTEKKARRYEHGLYTDLGEGDFSNIRSKLSDKAGLSVAMTRLGLEKYLLMGEGDTKMGIANEPSVKEDLFESIIGAIYIDSRSDMKSVICAVRHMLDISEYEKGKEVIQSNKNALQEFCADKRRRLPAPIYETLSESGPEHKKSYERGCYIGGVLYGKGCGKNLKIADSLAAEAALARLKEEHLKPSPEAKQNSQAITALKVFAEKNKKPSPEFHDLGETLRSTPTRREYEIECRFMGQVARASAIDKRTAKSLAAEKILKLIRDEVSIGSANKKRHKKQID